MTVGELRRALEGAADDLVVLISYDAGAQLEWVEDGEAAVACLDGPLRLIPDGPLAPAGAKYFRIGSPTD